MTNLVKDVVSLVYALGYQSVAGWWGTISARVGNASPSLDLKQVAAALATLDPPRKHYVLYYSTPDANTHMMGSPDGLRAFLREYYHVKSADWEHNEPHPLAAPQAAVMAKEELGVYVGEYTRTGFQGGLNSYRMATSTTWSSDRELFSGKQIDVPAMFLAGKQDWGTWQMPGAACKNMDDFVLIDGAGHWVQQEQSEEVVNQLLRFFRKSTK
ncbi:Alpha/Beta hydrolase protein [Mycena galopus ATCC 62051]|nr:Alpha/Beta hydrolase protein [Mycena galopus ATCC 62051]